MVSRFKGQNDSNRSYFVKKNRILLTIIMLLLQLGVDAHAEAWNPAGSQVMYSCSPGPAKERKVIFLKGSTNHLSIIDTYIGGRSREGRLELWHYLTNLAESSSEGSRLKIMRLKSGTLAQANPLIPGKSYSGIVEYWDRSKSHDMEVAISVGKAEREKTPLGVQLLTSVKSTIRNVDGKKGEMKVEVKFSNAFKLNFSEVVSGADAEQNRNCSIQSVKKESPGVLQEQVRLTYPPANSVMRFACTGRFQSLDFKILKNNGVEVDVAGNRGNEKFGLGGPIWAIYMGLNTRGAVGGTTFRIIGNELSLLAKSVSPGVYLGSAKRSNGVSMNIQVGVQPKTSYFSKKFGSLDVIPIDTARSSGGLNSGSPSKFDRSRILFAPAINAPAWFSTAVFDKSNTWTKLECALLSLSSVK